MNLRVAAIVAAVAGVAAVALISGVRTGSVRRGTQSPAVATGEGPVLAAPVIPFTTELPPTRGAPAGDLVDYLRGVAGSRYAGLWLASSPRPGFRLGVVRPTWTDIAKAQKAFADIGTPGEVVPQVFSERKLGQVNAYLADRLNTVNRGSPASVSIGYRPDLNAIEMSAPPVESVTPKQRVFVESAVRDFGAAIRVSTAQAQRSTTLPCLSVFCDPPLRSGIWNYAGLTGCTASFLARSKSDGLLYQVTAGHCRVVWNATWVTEFVNGVPHRIGPIHNSRFDRSGDMGITRVLNPPGWRSRAWVTVRAGTGVAGDAEYPIYADAAPVVGTRVCVSGGATGAANCGVVTRTDVTVTYSDRNVTVSGLAEASVCTTHGDSGSPVFAGHVAYGTVSGNSSRCRTYFEPVSAVSRTLNVFIAHEAR